VKGERTEGKGSRRGENTRTKKKKLAAAYLREGGETKTRRDSGQKTARPKRKAVRGTPRGHREKSAHQRGIRRVTSRSQGRAKIIKDTIVFRGKKSGAQTEEDSNAATGGEMTET